MIGTHCNDQTCGCQLTERRQDQAFADAERARNLAAAKRDTEQHAKDGK